ncbi:MAG: ATP-binding protein, partial [Candidatus Marinimicrobia bacterium]|nr:ATP-binding protein [Candidatus Neomarinimicrobiota bacterium]
LLDPSRTGKLREEVEELRVFVAVLPSHLHKRLKTLAVSVRAQYRTAIISAWVCAIVALVLLVTSIRMFFKWFAKPLEILVEGSGKVALGKYSHRIRLDTRDEMGELAEAMNDMTAQFQATRNDLDQQVRERSTELVRSEQLASVGFLAAGVAHEIGNPLTSISSLVQLLERRMTNPDHISKLSRIRANIERITKIVHELVDFTRPQATDVQHVQINDVIQNAVGLMAYDNRSQKINIELDLTSDLPRVKASPDKLHQVVVNLLVNAFDAMKEMGDTIRITTGEQQAAIFIRVEDNGGGMDPDVQDKIFEPFFTTKDVGKGTGLGLSVSHGIINSMRGQLRVDSEPGAGATFLIEIPKEK